MRCRPDFPAHPRGGAATWRAPRPLPDLARPSGRREPLITSIRAKRHGRECRDEVSPHGRPAARCLVRGLSTPSVVAAGLRLRHVLGTVRVVAGGRAPYGHEHSQGLVPSRDSHGQGLLTGRAHQRPLRAGLMLGFTHPLTIERPAAESRPATCSAIVRATGGSFGADGPIPFRMPRTGTSRVIGSRVRPCRRVRRCRLVRLNFRSRMGRGRP